MLTTLGDISDCYELVIHPGKTEYMVIQPTIDNNTITYRFTPIPRVTSFKYLGVSINHTLDNSKEVRMRIGMGKSTLRQFKYLRSPRISLEVKIQLARGLILSRVLLYGATTMSLKAADIKSLDSFGRTIWRHLLNIKWQDHVSNEKLMELIGDRWCFSSNAVIERKAAWLGHVFRQGGIASAVVDGMPEGCRHSLGRRKMRWVDNIRKWSGCNISELREAALQRRAVVEAVPVIPAAYNLRRRLRATAYV